eukprot:GHVN01068817.1.p1 GENE.GHVN01068817.1~~GHVN01068817.1.p1  ORF type:complete len:808 (+),score=117.99 GHVN01068817.1:719-3142(+)
MKKRADWLYEAFFKPAIEKKDTDDLPLYECSVKYEGDPNEAVHIIRDTFSFGVMLPEYDLKLFQSGSCWHVDDLMGSHRMVVQGCEGIRFSVWAPNAVHLSVVGDWNGWDGRAHPLRKRHEFGVWEGFVPGIHNGEKYGYRIHSQDETDFVKIDPYAQKFENPPAYASIISECDDSYKPVDKRYKWGDTNWMTKRATTPRAEFKRQPCSIYECHLPSWRRGADNAYLTYRQLADPLVGHLKNLNFTHVEFLPVTHHPFEGSWGYQVTGLYAPYSRLGSADDLKYLIDTLHQNGIGVILDLVIAHFCKDAWGLTHYDGQPCYEYSDPREGEHKGWGTAAFNFRRNEVRTFLLGSVYHWMRIYHLDGIRIDAVSSMIYKNYCRKDGEWVPNELGGDANLEAVSLLREMNWVVEQEFPSTIMIAEESTSWQGVTGRDKGGLGFDCKWDLGWMNDVLKYLTAPYDKRADMHDRLTFRGLYLACERWVLPLSHDEVVNGKGSLLDKCGYKGTPVEERYKTLRCLFGYQVALPGRPLIFMGAEFGQGREWEDNRSVDWHEAEEEPRKKICTWVADIMAMYRHDKALHAGDDEHWNFQWTDCDNSNGGVISFLRKYAHWTNDVLFVCNFSGNKYDKYPVGVPHGREWEVMVNSDDWRYGGSMQGPGNLSHLSASQGGRIGWDYCLWIDLAPFSCCFLRPHCPTERAEYEKSLNDEGATEQTDDDDKTGSAEKKDETNQTKMTRETEKTDEHNKADVKLAAHGKENSGNTAVSQPTSTGTVSATAGTATTTPSTTNSAAATTAKTTTSTSKVADK